MLCNLAHADTYRIISIKGCTASLNNIQVQEGDVVSENSKFKIEKVSESASWIIKLQSMSSGKIYPLCSPTSNSTKSSYSYDSWLSTFWNSITGQKKCSTRAPENELTDGLTQNLSQTFYLTIPYNPEQSSTVDFVTNLPNGTRFICDYKYGDLSYSFEIPILNSQFSLSPEYFEVNNFSDDITVLRILVKYISETGKVTPITDSMNVILLKE